MPVWKHRQEYGRACKFPTVLPDGHFQSALTRKENDLHAWRNLDQLLMLVLYQKLKPQIQYSSPGICVKEASICFNIFPLIKQQPVEEKQK